MSGAAAGPSAAVSGLKSGALRAVEGPGNSIGLADSLAINGAKSET